MSTLGSVDLKIEVLPGELKIQYARRAGWVEQIAAPVVAGLCLVAGLTFHRPALIVVTSGLVIVLIFLLAWNHERVLRVLPDRLIFSSYFQNAKEIMLRDVKGMRWQARTSLDDGGSPDGLYVLRGERRECVLPLVSEEAAQVAIDAIYKHFPEYPLNPAG